MSSLPSDTFSSLLRHHRQAAGLTQEELAERAHLSVQAIGALERGDRRAPRKETVSLLAEALSLTAPDRAVFAASARQRGQADRSTPGDDSRADASATSNVRQRYQDGGIPYSEINNPPVPRSRRKPSASMISVLIVVLLGSALLLVEPGADAVLGGQSLPCGGALALATDFPTSGSDGSTQGKSVRNAVDLAVMQNQNLGSGYTLKAINFNDAAPQTGIHDPTIGERNVRQLVQNPCIMGLVGPLHSNMAPSEMPIAANAGLVVISPGNTNPALTLRPYADTQGLPFDRLHPPGKPISYFRDIPNDAAQAIADAHVAFDLGAKSAYVIHDPSPYGEMLAGVFTQAFEGKGGRVAGIDRIGPDAAGVPDVAARIVASNPDAVFYGGLASSGAGPLKGQLVTLGYKGPLIGADGLANDQNYVEQAGVDAANGTFASIGGVDPSTFTSGGAAQFLSDYAARYPGQEPSFNAAYAYDAAMVLITALKHLIVAGQPVTRAALIGQVQRIQYAGVTGPISFDINGDVAHGLFSMYTVRDGKWTYAWQVSL